MNTIKKIIEQNDTKGGRVFDIFIQSLIILSLISFSIETIPTISITLRKILNVSELVIIIVFSIEYILRLIVSDKKLRFIFSFYGLIDLVAILPFYITTGLDLRSIRALRLLRLLRTFKLMRYSNAIKRFQRALIIAKEELILFLFITLILLFLSGAGIYFFENPAQPEVFTSVFDSLWWAVATLTTVGYGDIYPITVGGRLFTFLILMIGLGIVAVPTGILASALSKSREEDID